jgi:hypothetical protein
MPLLCSYRHFRLRANAENCWSPWLCLVSWALRWSRSRQQSNRRSWRRLVRRVAVWENLTFALKSSESPRFEVGGDPP